MTVNLDIILYIAGALITVSGAFAIMVRFAKKAITSVAEESISEIASSLEEKFAEDLCTVEDSLKAIIEINKRRDDETRFLTLKNTASRIFEAHSYYCERGSITTFALANLEELFLAYTAQGGNSYVLLCMSQIRDLPIVDAPWDREVLEQKREIETLLKRSESRSES